MKFKSLLLSLLICSALQSAQYTISVGQRDFFDTSDGVEVTTVSDRTQQVIDAAIAAGAPIPILELDTIEGNDVARAVTTLDFSSISSEIIAANLKIYAKPIAGSDDPYNDVIGIGYSDIELGTGLFSTIYEHTIGLGTATGNSYFNFDWDASNPNLPTPLNEGYEINLDLSNFATVGYYSGNPDAQGVNILPHLNNYKALDLHIFDDSTIDYIELTISTDSDPPITVFTVTATAGENGSVEPSSPVVYYSPTEVTLTAVPENGYLFSNWTGDITDSLSTNNPLILLLSSDTAITANFVEEVNNPLANLTFTLNGDGTEYSVTDCSKTAEGSLVIPATYNGLPVTSIRENTFKECINLNSVVLPEGITSIEYRTFYNCTGLSIVTIPNTVTSIGDRSFYNCTSLTDITIPDSVTTIGEESFYNTGITSIVVPDSVTSIGYAAFRKCSSLTTATLPDDLTRIEWGTFLDIGFAEDGPVLTSINIPSNLEFIGGSSIPIPSEIPDSVTCYGPGNGGGFGFSGDPTVIFSGGLGYRLSSSGTNAYIVELEGQPTFVNPDTGTILSGDIVIPQTIDGAAVQSVTFTGWFSSGNTAPGITGITVSEGIVSIADAGFWGFEDLVSINLPDSLTLIDWVAFKDCTSLSSITIPKNVSDIGGSVFNGASNLNEIIVDPDNAHYISVDNSLYDISLQTLVRCRADATDFIVPDTVTTVEHGAFAGCSNLTSVTIPNSVTSIRGSAFSGCTGLTSITIPNGVQKIKQDTFENCSALRQVLIPASVTTIEEGAFAGCSSLEMVIFKGSSPVEYGIGDYEYPGPEDIPMATGAKAYVMPQYLSTFGSEGDSWSGLTLSTQLLTYVLNTDGTEYSLTDCAESFVGEIEIPSTYNGLPVTSIGDSAFQDCTSITRITIPDSIASVESYAFRNCNSLGTITSEAITAPTLGSNAFENIPATKIAIPIGSKQSYLEAGDGTSYGGLAVSYGSLIDGVISEARTEGQQDVITSPLSYGLYSPSYVISLLDSSRNAGQNDVTGDPSSYGLYSEQGITDLRAGSTILQLGPNNSATLQLQIERSIDLSSWTADAEDLLEVDIPLNGDTEFFRFKMTE